MRLILPYPISANRYWVTFPYIDKVTRKPKAVTVPSGEAKAYKQEVGYRAKLAGFREPTAKPIEIQSITLHPKMNKDGSASGTVLDLMNCWKVVEDALQGVAYLNDKQIKRVRNVEYGAPTLSGLLVIDIVEFVPPPAPIFAPPAKDEGLPF